MKAVVSCFPRVCARQRCIARFGELNLPFEFMDAVDARMLSELDIAAWSDTHDTADVGEFGLWLQPSLRAGTHSSSRSSKRALDSIQ